MDEFEAIRRWFRPLTGGAPEAADLLDDAAFVRLGGQEELVITVDAMVEGVHFLPDDPPDLVARKLLRVNLSDLAAKAARPFGYLLSVAWPQAWDDQAREAFARGLAEDQALYGINLLGGDTVSTPGPMTASVTALGKVEWSRSVRRSRARAGNAVHVSGTIGDGWLGLQAARGELDAPEADLAYLADRYRLPQPRLDLRPALLEQATACADVSDGLVADAGRIAEASGVGIALDLDAVPLSPAATAWLARQPDRTEALVQLATGGDDYELLVTAYAGFAGATPATRIGSVLEGEGVKVACGGREVPIGRPGWRHA
jgi:thiamine-monophosphate kinase